MKVEWSSLSRETNKEDIKQHKRIKLALQRKVLLFLRLNFSGLWGDVQSGLL